MKKKSLRYQIVANVSCMHEYLHVLITLAGRCVVVNYVAVAERCSLDSQ